MSWSSKNNKIKWSSPGLVALVPFIITIVFTPGFLKKYKLELISQEFVNKNTPHYADLDHDGNSELIQTYTYLNAQIMIKNLSGKLEEVYNLPGKWISDKAELPVIHTGDYNNDGLDEIFAFTIDEKDSLFISLISHYNERKILKNKFIINLEVSEKGLDYLIIPLGLTDNNGDGRSEFLFIINAGYPLQPRAVFAWDLKADSVYRSPLMGQAIKINESNYYLTDIDGDSIKELFVRTAAVDNHKDVVPYDDHNSWIMVFTRNLQFLFEPVKIPGPQTGIYHFPYKTGTSLYVGACIINERAGNTFPEFVLYNKKGEKIREIYMKESDDYPFSAFCNENGQHYMFSHDKGLLTASILNRDLKQIKRSISLNRTNGSGLLHDVDNDIHEEVILYSDLDEKIYISRYNLKNMVSSTIGMTKKRGSINISVVLKNKKPDLLLIVIKGVANYMRYSRNPFYYFNFVIALGYYLVLLFAFYQLRKAWLHNLHQKEKTEKQLQHLQLQAVINQLDPHFAFNAMNTIGDAILKKDTDKAYQSLTKMSSLLRRSVDHAFQPWKTLGEEIRFVHDYLEVEKLRFGDKLEYEITIDSNIDLDIRIPKMLMMIFVENAVRHGLCPKNDTGKIIVDISQQKELIKITIQDNGIGRKKATQLYTNRKGKGITILENYLKLFKEQFHRKITFELKDLYEEEGACGTRVEINIPV